MSHSEPRPTYEHTGAAILAGGASSRMGQNKALMRPGSAGATILDMVIARLAEAGFQSPILISNNPEEYAALSIEIVRDDTPGLGPIGGVLTALRHAQHERVLVVACDMPLLSPALLRYMVSIAGKYEAIAPTWHDTSGKRRVEPLHTVYSKYALPVIEQRISAGSLKMRDLLGALNTRYLPEEEIREHDPGLNSLLNINTPEELARLLI